MWGWDCQSGGDAVDYCLGGNMADISINKSARETLLSLRDTQAAQTETRRRVSTGLRVSTIADNPAAYGQARELSERASDFLTVKDGVDQAVSGIMSAINGVESMASIVEQMRGILSAARSGLEPDARGNMAAQFDELYSQLNLVAKDASYQGVNLIGDDGSKAFDKTSQPIKVSLNPDSSAVAEIPGQYLGASYYATSGDPIDSAFTVDPAQRTLSEIKFDTPPASAGDLDETSGTLQQTNNFKEISVTAADYSSDPLKITADVNGTPKDLEIYRTGIGMCNSWVYQGFTDTASIDAALHHVDGALSKLRSQSALYALSVQTLQTRIDFTEKYTTTLKTGAGALTDANLNEEGANLIALETKQQLAVSSLAIVSKGEQAIGKLFK